MRHIAIIGSGPAGYYTAEAAQRQWGPSVKIDILDKLPVPFGLIRSGVAPDHQTIKAVARRYEAVAVTDNVRFVGNLSVGEDISVAELQALYDAVILATGAPRDRPLGLPGDDLGNVFGSAAFVGWYNGHPQYTDLAPDLTGRHAIVIGNGNVALDVARLLAKTPEEFAGSDITTQALAALAQSRVETVTILGRRGPHQIAMTQKELGEMGKLARAHVVVNPVDLPPEGADAGLDAGLRKAMGLLRGFAARSGDEPISGGAPIRLAFRFFSAPRALVGHGRVEALEVERTRLEDGKPVGTGAVERLPADIVISCIGYKSVPLAGVPYDERAGRFSNEEGRIMAGLYCVGWARRGPTGTIGTNRPDGYAVIEKIAVDQPEASGKDGREGLDRLIARRGLEVVTFRDWQKIDAAEVAHARPGAPREKLTHVDEMLHAAHPGA